MSVLHEAGWSYYLINYLQRAGLFAEAAFEWIMDVSQLPPKSICALSDVEASTHNGLFSGDVFAAQTDSSGTNGPFSITPTLKSYIIIWS